MSRRPSITALVAVDSDVDAPEGWWPWAALIAVFPAPGVEDDDLAARVGGHTLAHVVEAVRTHLDGLEERFQRPVTPSWTLRGSADAWVELADRRGVRWREDRTLHFNDDDLR